MTGVMDSQIIRSLLVAGSIVEIVRDTQPVYSRRTDRTAVVF